MQLQASDITIGITMYRRLDYLEQAIASAVNQTVPVRVFVQDDGCDNLPELRRILAKFGDRVEYRRNSRTLTLFRNMNACIDSCPTPWLSILHDDDYLEPHFVETLLKAAPAIADDCVLICAATDFVRADGTPFNRNGPPAGAPARVLTAEDFARNNWFCFPGQLMRASVAKEAGGFRENAIYTGDWDLWFRMALLGPVIQLSDKLSCYRTHSNLERCTTFAVRTGRQFACCAMQSKKNFAVLRKHKQASGDLRFNRTAWLENWRPSYRELLYYGRHMPRWLFSYNRKLLLFLGRPSGRAPRIIHSVSRLFGNAGVKFAASAMAGLRRLGVREPRSL